MEQARDTTPDAQRRPLAATVGRAVLLLLVVYHLITGIVAVFLPEFSRVFYQVLYHADPYYWDQYVLILKPWGSYALFTGMVLFLAWREPRRYRGVMVAMVALLALRCANRLMFAEQVEAVLGIDPARNALNVALMVGWIVALVAWLVVDRAEAGSPAPVRERETTHAS